MINMKQQEQGWPVLARAIGVSAALGLLLALVLAASSGPGVQAAPASLAPTHWQKSISLWPRWSEDFGSAGSDAAIEQARGANANYVTLIIPFQQDNIYSTAIYKASYAPSDAALIHAIGKAHSLGMKVSIKPHIDPNDGRWRAEINPGDRNSWFQNYGTILNHYASLGQQYGVEQIVVGAELITMATATSNPDNTPRWRGLIGQVRQRFSGSLTYSANWGGNYFAEEFPHISFWDALDYIGISAYFELANYNNPGVSQLVDSWSYWNTNKIQPLQQSVGKPVVFTEVGYRSVDGAASHPWDWGMSGPGNYNAQEQINAIQALSQYWSNYSWFAGLQYWSWSTDSNCCGAGHTGYEVQNKPAYETLRTAFSGDPADPVTTFSMASASVTPVTARPGANFALNASLRASANSQVLVDMEVYDGAGRKVYQHFMGNQTFVAGQTRNFTFNWASPNTQAAGEYTLSVGVFTNDWRTSYLWSSSAASFVIDAASPPTPPPGTPTPTPTTVPGQYAMEIWWPVNGATLSGVQPFKAKLSNVDLSQYTMYWQVDGGQLNSMPDNSTDGPHKEAAVNISAWNWRGRGPYTLNFVAKDASGRVLRQQSVQINVQN